MADRGKADWLVRLESEPAQDTGARFLLLPVFLFLLLVAWDGGGCGGFAKEGVDLKSANRRDANEEEEEQACMACRYAHG